MKAQNDKLVQKIKKVNKKMAQMQEASKAQIDSLQAEVARKAEKESLIESQQKFFDNLAKIENETGETLSKLVEEELRKISVFIDTNSRMVEKRF